MSLRTVPVTSPRRKRSSVTGTATTAPPAGHKYSIGVAKDEMLVGVAIVGRPVARLLDDDHTLEVVRVATDGTRNACS